LFWDGATAIAGVSRFQSNLLLSFLNERENRLHFSRTVCLPLFFPFFESQLLVFYF